MEAELEKTKMASRTLPEYLQPPEWSGAFKDEAETSGEGAATDAAGEPQADLPVASAATSASEPLGNLLAEGVAEPEPAVQENLPDLFIEQHDEDTEYHRAGIDFAQLQRELGHWPSWSREERKSLKECYPEAAWFDKDQRRWYGESTPRPSDGILRLHSVYLLNSGRGIRVHKCPAGKWFMMPAHHPGTKCPQYLKPWEYEQTQRWGRKIAKVLRHTNRRGKLGDGATMDPTKLAVICSQIRRCRLSVRDIWKIVQEGQADSKCRVMVLLATHYDGKIMGWSNKFGPESAHDECTDFSYRTYYDNNDTCVDMRVVGFKCTQ